MEQMNLWLSLLTAIVLAMLVMPSIVAFNRGKIMRQLALWLAIFVILGWAYKLFGPFGTAAEARFGAKPPITEQTGEAGESMDADGAPAGAADTLGDGYSPPQE